MNKEEYIKILTDQIRCKMARPEVARELEDHIEDQTRAFMSEGLDRIEAEKAAVKEMGNPVETGVELDKIHRPKMPWGTISLIIVLSILSCTFQYFLNREYIKAGGDGYGMGRHIMFTATGILVMIGVCFADYTRIAARARELMLGWILLLILGKQFFGITVNDAERWIALPGGQAVNILLMLMLTVPLYAAILYGYRGKGWSVIWKGVLWMVPAAGKSSICGNMYYCRAASGSDGSFDLVFWRGLSEKPPSVLSVAVDRRPWRTAGYDIIWDDICEGNPGEQPAGWRSRCRSA